MRFGSGLYFFGGGIPVPSIPSISFNVPGIPSQTGVTNRPFDLTAKIPCRCRSSMSVSRFPRYVSHTDPHHSEILRQMAQEKTNEGEVERRMSEGKLQHIATNHQGSFTDAQGRYLLPTFVNHRP
jgi:hypothetical protein